MKCIRMEELEKKIQQLEDQARSPAKIVAVERGDAGTKRGQEAPPTEGRKKIKQSSSSGSGGGEKVDGRSRPIEADKLNLVKEMHECLEEMYASVDVGKRCEKGTFEFAVKTGNVDAPSAPFGKATQEKMKAEHSDLAGRFLRLSVEEVN